MAHSEVNFLDFGLRRSNSDGEIRCQMSKYKCNELQGMVSMKLILVISYLVMFIVMTKLCYQN